MYCKVPCSLQSLSSLPCSCSYRVHCRPPVSTRQRAPQLASTGRLSCSMHFAKDFAVCKHVIIYRSTCIYDGGTWRFTVDQTCHILCTLRYGVCRVLGPELLDTENFTVCPVDRWLGKPFVNCACTTWFAKFFHLLPPLKLICEMGSWFLPINLLPRAIVGITQGTGGERSACRGV